MSSRKEPDPYNNRADFGRTKSYGCRSGIVTLCSPQKEAENGTNHLVRYRSTSTHLSCNTFHLVHNPLEATQFFSLFKHRCTQYCVHCSQCSVS